MGELLRNRYAPLESLGQGGEGRVVRALDHQLGRQVALKIRHAPAGAKRDDLLREARLLLSLDPHPGLPIVREDFFDGDEYVIAMDWIEGSDLGRLLRERGTPGLAPSTVLRHLAHVAEALTHLHAHDPPVIHGDVKPGNIIVTRGGRVVLVDFGIAASGADERGRVGTHGFIAPEVAAGGSRTPSSDVYSLAMTAFALLSGTDHVGGAPVWPATMDTERARVFERAIVLGTATDPRRRPSSAGEFLELLRADWEADLPTGVVTVCMTDIEGSTTLWESHPHAMAAALVRHDAILAQAVESRRGRLIKSMGEGDSSVSVFTSAIDAVPAAVDIVRMIREEEWPDGLDLRVRIGLHTGAAELRDGDHFGPTANRTARVRGLADGGQVFVSEVTARLVQSHLPDGFALVDLGLHALRGVNEREHVFAVSAPSVFAPPSPADCPYRGLLAFEPEDQDLYFGRETVVADLLSRVARGGFVAVVGASGSGKSSLVRAGLVPAVRRGEVAGVSSALVFTPGTEPMRALNAALAPGVPGNAAPLNSAAAQLLLVVDQFEEMFTLCTDAKARAQFVEMLLEHPGKVVISLRGDFYGHCAAYPSLAAAVSAENILLGPMRPDDLRRAIEAPAKAAGLSLESGLVDVILRDTADEPGALPLLSHALMETWARRDGRALTLAGYHDSGGVRRAIARTADDMFTACTDPERILIRRIFLRLTELGEGTEDTRRRVRLSELLSESASSTAGLLETMTRARLLIVDGDTAEVAHEALIREWPRLRAWLNEDREGLRLHRHLTQSAGAWEAMDRDPGELYRGARLTATLDWSGSAEMTTVEREFLDASRGEQDRELRITLKRNRRLRSLLAGVALALIAALVAGALALGARGNAARAAVRAQAGRIAAQAREAAAKHPDLGLLLALEAVNLRPSVETRGALLGALERGGRIAGELQGLTAPPGDTAFSPDGKMLATVGFDGTTLWDVATHRAIGGPLRSQQGGWKGVDFSPDGKTLAITGKQGKVELWNVATRREIREMSSPGGAWLAWVRYSPDGRVIAASGDEDNHVTLFDVASGRVMGKPIAPHPPGTSAGRFAFSPNSKLIAMQTETGVRLWTVATGRPARTPFVAGDGPVGAQSFTPDGRAIVGVDNAGSVSTWDMKTGRRIGKSFFVGEETVHGLDVSPDGRLIAVGSSSGTVRVWDASTGVPFGSSLIADSTPVWDVAFSPDSKLLASVADRSAVLWDLSGRNAIGEPLGSMRDVSTDVAFRPDGTQVAIGHLDGSIGIFDVATRMELGRIATGAMVYSLRYSPDGKVIAAGSNDGKVRFWDEATRLPSGQPLDAGAAFIWQIAFSPDGKLLAVAADPNGPRNIYIPDRDAEAQLWDVSTRHRVGKAMVPGKHSIISLAFSPDGKRLATGSFEERLELWNVADQTPFGQPMDIKENGVIALAFAPDGKRVAAAGLGPVRIWDVMTQTLAVAPLAGHNDAVLGAAYDLSGRFLATTSFGATRVWDPATGLAYGDELQAAPKPASLQTPIDVPLFPPVRNAFSPDGRFLVTGGVDTLAMIWDVDPATWGARACDIVGRNLSREEWRVYLPRGTPYRATCVQWPAG